jgi:hypothetical protein
MTDYIFDSPFLGKIVYLTRERIEHIRGGHPEFNAMDEPVMIETIRATIEKPSIIVPSRKDPDGLVFAKWEPNIYGGKYVVVTVIASLERNWIITAFISRYKPKGVVLWMQD